MSTYGATENTLEPAAAWVGPAEALCTSAVAVAAIAATRSAPVRTAIRRRPGAGVVMGGSYLSVWGQEGDITGRV